MHNLQFIHHGLPEGRCFPEIMFVIRRRWVRRLHLFNRHCFTTQTLARTLDTREWTRLLGWSILVLINFPSLHVTEDEKLWSTINQWKYSRRRAADSGRPAGASHAVQCIFYLKHTDNTLVNHWNRNNQLNWVHFFLRFLRFRTQRVLQHCASNCAPSSLRLAAPRPVFRKYKNKRSAQYRLIFYAIYALMMVYLSTRSIINWLIHIRIRYFGRYLNCTIFCRYYKVENRMCNLDVIHSNLTFKALYFSGKEENDDVGYFVTYLLIVMYIVILSSGVGIFCVSFQMFFYFFVAWLGTNS